MLETAALSFESSTGREGRWERERGKREGGRGRGEGGRRGRKRGREGRRKGGSEGEREGGKEGEEGEGGRDVGHYNNICHTSSLEWQKLRSSVLGCMATNFN